MIDSHVPEYRIEDGGDEVKIIIWAPLCKPKEAALILEKNVFTFDSPPYLLKIKLPQFVSKEFSQQAFDEETGTYKVKFKKIRHRDSDGSSDEYEEKFFSSKEETEANGNKASSKVRQSYGFANSYSNMFGKLYNEFSEIVNLPEPDNTNVSDRRRLRLIEENSKWDEDHYLADTMETEHLEFIFKYKPPWISSPVKGKELNNDEKEMVEELLKKTKNKNLSEDNKKLSEFQIVDILFCYAYNKRTTEGENTVESGWTINKLSSTLSWFEVFEDLRSVLISCFRRSLIYPLFRNWNLCQAIKKDVVNILKIGPKQVTRSLIEVLEIFNESDNRYLLNTLYLNDLCCFAYEMTTARSIELSEELDKINIKKCEIIEDLPLLEIAAHLTLEEESKGCNEVSEGNVKSVIDKISKLDLDKSSSSNDSSDSGSEDDSDVTESSDNEE